MGRTTHWERRGNEHADRLAKLGAVAHGLTKTHLAEAAVLSSLAFQAARCAGEARVLVQDAMQRGHHQPRRPRSRLPGLLLESRGPKRLKAQPGGQAGPDSAWCSAPAAAQPDCDEFGGHKVALAAVRAESGAPLGPIAFCQACGAYFWHRVGSLSRPCRGAKPYGQLALLKRGALPSHQRALPRLVGRSRPAREAFARLAVAATAQCQPRQCGSVPPRAAQAELQNGPSGQRASGGDEPSGAPESLWPHRARPRGGSRENGHRQALCPVSQVLLRQRVYQRVSWH